MHHHAVLRRSVTLALGLVACNREPAPADGPAAAAPVGPASGVEATPAPVATPDPAPTPTPTPTPTPSETLRGTAVAEVVGTPAVDVAGTTPPPTPTGPTIVVVGEGGVKELGLDGAVIRTLGSTPGRSPRWLPGKRELVFLGTKDGVSTELRALVLADGAERRIAKLPLRPPCPPKAYKAADEEVPVLDLTNEEELRVTPKGDTVCMTASDYSADLRTIDLELAIGLADGKVDAAFVFGGDQCDREHEERPEVCESPDDEGSPEAPEIESPFSNTYVESRSPDGHWLLVELASALGDVLHRQLVLYDARTKKSYPLPRNGKGEWPEPMAKVPAIRGEDVTIPGLPEVGGEEAIVWVGEHHLVIGRTLFVAGERVVELPGDVAY
jgi:hypothetical protein